MKTIIFKIKYLGVCGTGFPKKIIREIELAEEQTFDDLEEILIEKSFNWDDPHLYSFFLDNKPFSKDRSQEYTYYDEQDYFTGEKANSTKTPLKEIEFEKGQKFLMIFDFGDEHRFEIKIKDFRIAEKGKNYPLILNEIGNAPEQYEIGDEDEQ
ncbi:MAG: hypothetical protein ABIG37_00255 [Nanoarchaeota archaeon]